MRPIMIQPILSLAYNSPSRRPLLQHDENAKGKISTQDAQESFEREDGAHHPGWH